MENNVVYAIRIRKDKKKYYVEELEKGIWCAFCYEYSDIQALKNVLEMVKEEIFWREG